MKKFKAWETKHGFPEDVSATSESVKKEASKEEADRVSTSKRQLNMVSMKAALEEKKAIVKTNDEDKGEKVKRHKDRNEKG